MCNGSYAIVIIDEATRQHVAEQPMLCPEEVVGAQPARWADQRPCTQITPYLTVTVSARSLLAGASWSAVTSYEVFVLDALPERSIPFSTAPFNYSSAFVDALWLNCRIHCAPIPAVQSSWSFFILGAGATRRRNVTVVEVRAAATHRTGFQSTALTYVPSLVRSPQRITHTSR